MSDAGGEGGPARRVKIKSETHLHGSMAHDRLPFGGVHGMMEARQGVACSDVLESTPRIQIEVRLKLAFIDVTSPSPSEGCI